MGGQNRVAGVKLVSVVGRQWEDGLTQVRLEHLRVLLERQGVRQPMKE